MAVAVVMLGVAMAALAAEPAGPIKAENYKGPIKLACVGDSITAGSGTTGKNSYPAQLRRMLGRKWEVSNFGSSGRTLLNSGDVPYQTKGKFKEALASKPDVVVIMLGTNDSKPQNWKHKDQFAADLKDMVGRFQKLESKPRVFINTPPTVVGDGKFGINEAAVEEQLPIIEKVAGEMGATVIDVHAATVGKDALFPDHVHPNNAGAEVLAKTVYTALTGKVFTESVIQKPETTTKKAG
jgi:lysophospholipase L1-like esterase